MKSILSVACLAGALLLPVQAAVITFEGAAPPGGQINPVSYTEEGYTINAVNGLWGIFDGGSPIGFDGTTWLGFGEGNAITLSGGPGVFNLVSLTLGKSGLSSSSTQEFTITGNLAAGGTISKTFTGVFTVTSELIGFEDLTSVTFTSTDDAGIDNVTLATPEPASMGLLGAGLIGIAFAGRRKARGAKI